MAWSWVAIGQLCRLVNGRAFKPSDWTKDGLPIVRIQNLNDRTKPFNRYNGNVDQKVLIDSGDILLSWSGTPGTSFGCFFWDRGPAILNQHIFRVHIDTTRVEPEFFIHAVNSRLEEMIGLAHGGVGLRHITKGKLEGIKVPVAPIQNQRCLVARIRECMERVDEVASLRAQSQAMATALLPAYLNDASKALEAPSVPLGDVLQDTQNGRSIRTDGELGDGAVLTLSAVRRLILDLSARKVANLDDAVAQKYQVKTGDVFISRSNTRELVGLASIVLDDVPPRTIYPDLLIRLTPNTERVRSRFLAYALRFPDVRRQIQDRASGSSQSMVKISGERLREVRIPVPSLLAQDSLVKELDEAYETCSLLQPALVQPEIGHLRSAVLRRAFPSEL
jgi:type I restriction enzyme S subunit